MIEPLLQAEQALLVGMLDRAEHLYWQVLERDAKNSIAVVGLAKVALERGDELTALEFARLALQVDAENVAAQRLEQRLTEVLTHRGSAIPPWPGGRVVDYPRSGAPAADGSGTSAAPGPGPGAVQPAAPEAGPGSGGPSAAKSRPAGTAERRGLLRRLIRRG